MDEIAPGRGDRLRFSVVLPTYGRAVHAAVCLRSLLHQDLDADYEVLVVHRRSDVETVRLLEQHRADQRVVGIEVTEPGVLPALRSGLAAAQAEFVSFTDDDAVYPTNWLSSLYRMFVQPGVVGAGGLIAEDGKGRSRRCTSRIAKITLSGRQHFGLYDRYPSRYARVDFLCGANMAYRREVLHETYFPDIVGIRGGAPGFESLLGCLVRRNGGHILCDTALAVRHVRAPRAEGTRLEEEQATLALARSRVFVLRHGLSPLGRRLLLMRAIVIGDRLLPGMIFLLLPKRLRNRSGAVLDVLRGTRRGWREPLIAPPTDSRGAAHRTGAAI